MRALALLFALLPSLASAAEAWSAKYPEGPVWIGETLYWAEMGGDAVMARPPGGQPEIAWSSPGCGPTALAPYGDGVAVLCHLTGSVVLLDGNWQRVRVIDRAGDGTKLRNPNDVTPDGTGGLWFSDPGPFSLDAGAVGRIWHLGREGKLTLAADGLRYGNGVHFDGTRLLVSEHLARQVLAYPVTDGRLGAKEVLFRLDDFDIPRPRYPLSGPDGLEVGPDGTIWFAEYGTARLLGWRKDRGLVAATATGAQFITNIAFGPDGQVAVTAPKDNTTPPFPGIVWLFPIADLERLMQ